MYPSTLFPLNLHFPSPAKSTPPREQFFNFNFESYSCIRRIKNSQFSPIICTQKRFPKTSTFWQIFPSSPTATKTYKIFFSLKISVSIVPQEKFASRGPPGVHPPLQPLFPLPISPSFRLRLNTLRQGGKKKKKRKLSRSGRRNVANIFSTRCSAKRTPPVFTTTSPRPTHSENVRTEREGNVETKKPPKGRG